jgi:hypothetical protein
VLTIAAIAPRSDIALWPEAASAPAADRAGIPQGSRAEARRAAFGLLHTA